MKKILALLSLVTIVGSLTSNAQSYSFTAVGGTYTSNTGGTVIHASGIDEAVSGALPIGFNFTMGCDSYSTFYCSSNGWISFGTAPVSAELTNNLNTGTVRPKLAPLWDDLAVGAAGNVNYVLTGTAPNRVLTVEWEEMEWYWLATTWGLSFQCKLYETSNRVEFVYTRNGNATANLDSPSASIGISLPASGNFISLSDVSGAPTASTVTETNNLASKPANGQIYRFDNTSVFCTGTPTAGTSSAAPATTNCASSTTTLTAAGMSTGCGYVYQWQSSPDNATWTNISGGTGVSYVASNTASTYYRLVTTCTGSGLSANGASTLVTFSGSVPVNDLPCNATLMTVGLTEVGNNTCSGNASEPATPSCWTAGSYNTVWFRFVATAANMTIQTFNSAITGTQIAAYSGACGSLTQIASACNADAGSCGFTTMTNSLLNLTGLSVGTTYYIVVDGDASAQGSFTVIVNPTGTAAPPVQGQDCILANPVCNQSMTISDPGYQGIGATCDIPSSYCLASAERGSAWYSFTTTVAGNINFDIIPNNWPGAPSTTAADYDFAIWQMGGGVTCASILAGTSTPLRCNYSGLGVTGLNGAAGNAPAAYPGFDASYEAQIANGVGQTYLLLINNHSTSVDGFTINFSAASPILYTAPTTVSWMGGNGVSTQWDLNANWGACNFPTCAINAVINPFTNQPMVTGTKTVRNITINPGATLTLAAGSTLEVCGDFINYGTINADPTSTVVMLGTAVNQTMTGSFTGTNALGNLTINKTSALNYVITNDDIDMKGSFLTANATSIFNSNGEYIKVAGNFTNNLGNTTYTNTGTAGTLEFNGTGAQTYNQGTTQLDLNNVVMNHTGTNVVLATNMFIKATTGTLTLTNGRIQTGANRVDVSNSANASVTVGNNNSYVFGNLYRTLNGAAGAYDFPVGTATLYERANINFTSATTIPRLQSRFDSWGTPALHTNGMSECATTYNIADENMGYWTINASANPTSGTYNTTLYCNGATNTAGVAAWTVEKSSDAGATWVLSGTCDPTSTAAVVKRNGMNGFSLFAAAQANTPMPVELLGFYGFSVGRENELHWSTQSEINSAYFVIERSKNGEDFYPFAQTPAQGNSTTEVKYSVVDNLPYFPLTYYRIRQVDLNGDYTYTPKIVVESDLQSDLTIYQIFPNPTSSNCSVEISVKSKENLVMTIVDSKGTIVHMKEFEMKGAGILEIPSKEWSNGVYFIRITSDSGKIATTKFVKE